MDEALRVQVQEILTKAEGGTEVYDNLVNSVNSLKSKANTEKSTGVKYKLALDDLTRKHTELNDHLSAHGYDGETDIDEFFVSLKPTKEKKKGDTFDINEIPEFRKLQKDFKRTTEELAEEKTKNQKAQKERQNNQISRALQSAFKNDKGEITHYGAESRIENLVLTGKLFVDPDDNKVYWNNPADADSPIDFKEGFNKFLEQAEIKRDLKNNQSAGGGGGTAGSYKPGEMTPAERIKHINSKATFNIGR